MATAQQLAHYQGMAAQCDYTHLAALISRSEWEPTVEQLRSLIAAVSRAATKMTDLDGMDAVIACLDRGHDELGSVCPAEIETDWVMALDIKERRI